MVVGAAVLVAATIVRRMRVGVRVGVGVAVSVLGAAGVSVGVSVGMIVMMGIGVAVGASVADGGAGVGVISDRICKGLFGSAMACQPVGSVACWLPDRTSNSPALIVAVKTLSPKLNW